LTIGEAQEGVRRIIVNPFRALLVQSYCQRL
jgi:hypothetical protein